MLHKKIKQVDTFDKVWKNISKYANSTKYKDLVYTKYIILKDINDNNKSITEFLEMSKKSGVEYVLMEIDHYYFCNNRDNIPKYIIDLFYFAFNKAKAMGLKCEVYSNASVLLLQGKWADEFWKPHFFDASIRTDKYTYRPVYKLDKNKYIVKYYDIKCAAKDNNLTYSQVWATCEETSRNKKCLINGNAYFYKEFVPIYDQPYIL